jgi:hypothetical protein
MSSKQTINKLEFENEWESWVGKTVIKHSKKPFKSTFQTSTVKDITINPYSKKKGFLMDDGSIVDCMQVALYTKPNSPSISFKDRLIILFKKIF